MRIVINGSGSRRLLSRIGIFIVDRGQSMGLVRYRACPTNIRTHPHSICRLAGSFYQNVCALSHPQRNHFGSVWLDRDEVVRNYSHLIAVDGETLQSLRACVDKPEAVRLTGLELELGETGVGDALGPCWHFGAVGIAFAVDEVVV